MQFDQVSVGKRANVFFDGKCVSHTVTLPNGVRKSVGVVLPSTLRFDLSTKEIMEVVDGNASHWCVRLNVSDAEWLRFNFVHVGTKVMVKSY